MERRVTSATSSARSSRLPCSLAVADLGGTYASFASVAMLFQSDADPGS
jgi:hypothetical protein